MGNKQSQSSDEEEREPNYTYHEDVLRNAQLLTTDNLHVGSPALVYESDNEEYYSAEEGDSDRSITPPRTRPESSSGEDFSDESSGEAEDNVEGGEDDLPSQALFTVPQTNSSISLISPGGRVLRSNQTSERGNASRYEEHDSISPELETSRWHLNDSSVLSTRSNPDSRQFTRSKNSQLSAQRLHSRSKLDSPFVPIRSSQNSVNVSSTEQSLPVRSPPNKRQSSETSGAGEKWAPPRKRFSNDVSPWKRGLGYFDSSDSDNECDEEARRRTRHSRSPKRVKMSQSIPTPGSKRSPPLLIGDKSDTVLSPKRRRVIDKQALQNVISDSVKRSHAGEGLGREGMTKRLRSQNYASSHAQGICEDKIDENSPCVPQGDGLFSLEKKRPRNGAFQPLIDAEDPSNIADEKSHNPNTSKMGRNVVKNSLGKLLPVRGQSERNANQNMSNKSKEIASDTVLSENRNLPPVVNVTENAGEKKSDFESPPNWQQTRKSHDHFSPAPTNEVAQILPGKITHADLSHEDQAANANPLANVVLTPPSSNNSSSRVHTQPLPQISPSFDSTSKRKKPSAAERLKKFWTAGTTFKSFFSTKTKFMPENLTKESSGLAASPLPSSPNADRQNERSHLHFSSSPSGSSGSQSFGAKRSHSKLVGSASSPFLNISAVSPIFASLSPLSSSDLPVDKGTERFSSILQMSAKAQKGEYQSQHQIARPTRMATRTSSRLQHSRAQLAAPSAHVPQSSADIQILQQLSQFQVLHFRLADTLDISVSLGDVADEATAGIVNWTDESLTHTVTKCSQQISARAGALMRAGCADYLMNKGGVMEAPDVLTTPAGGRFPKSVTALLHVVSPQLKHGESSAHSMPARLLEVYANCLRFANERLGLQSLSLPLIGQDLFTCEISIKAFFDSIIVFLTEGKANSSSSSVTFDLKTINLVISDATTTDLTAELINASLHRLAQEGLDSVARDVFSSYYGDNSPERNQVESIDRTKSGRPRLKRPKL